MKQWKPIQVQTYSGYRSEESPRHFTAGIIEFQVSRVLRRTMEETIDRRRLRRFLVRTIEGEEFILIHDVETSRWYLEMDL